MEYSNQKECKVGDYLFFNPDIGEEIKIPSRRIYRLISDNDNIQHLESTLDGNISKHKMRDWNMYFINLGNNPLIGEIIK